jgi:hypothetical protein
MAILTHRSNLGGVGGGKTTRLFFQATGDIRVTSTCAIALRSVVGDRSLASIGVIERGRVPNS